MSARGTNYSAESAEFRMLDQRGQLLRPPSDSWPSPAIPRSHAPRSSAIGFASGALRIPRAHQVELECLDPTARPENEADDSHVLVPMQSLVVALTNAVKVDRDGRGAVGRCQRQR